MNHNEHDVLIDSIEIWTAPAGTPFPAIDAKPRRPWRRVVPLSRWQRALRAVRAWLHARIRKVRKATS